MNLYFVGGSEGAWGKGPRTAFQSCVLAACVVLASGGCGTTSPTQLMVRVETDYALGTELKSFELTATGAREEAVLGSVLLTTLGANPRPWTVNLQAIDGAGPVTIRVVGTLDDADPPKTVERTVKTSFVEGEARFVLVAFTRRCEGVICAEGLMCNDQGLCADPNIDPAALPVWPRPPEGASGFKELCNEVDDNGDGTTDEGYSLSDDPMHCGTCQNACPKDNTCVGGSCVPPLTCRFGLADCDSGIPGCETDILENDANCGACGIQCGGVQGTCDNGRCSNPIVLTGGVATGENHTCAQFQDGQIGCFGLNDFSQLGASPTTSLPGTAGNMGVAVDDHTTYAFRGEALYYWGANPTIPPGDRVPNGTPQPLLDVRPNFISSVAAGGGRGTVVHGTGSGDTVQAWGDRRDGGLGDGVDIGECGDEADCWVVPQPIPAFSLGGSFHQPRQGPAMACINIAGGANTLSCWGKSRGEQTAYFGDGSTTGSALPTGIPGGGLSAVGHNAFCNQTDSAEGRPLVCAGEFDCGVASGADFVQVGDLANVGILAVGEGFGCAVVYDETFRSELVCWGRNPVNPAPTACLSRPTRLVPFEIVDVRASSDHLCVISRLGTLHCAGMNTHGKVGHGAVDTLQPFGQVLFP